jgi:hypothetical protein
MCNEFIPEDPDGRRLEQLFCHNALFPRPGLYILDYRTLSRENKLATVILMSETLCNSWK